MDYQERKKERKRSREEKETPQTDGSLSKRSLEKSNPHLFAPAHSRLRSKPGSRNIDQTVDPPRPCSNSIPSPDPPIAISHPLPFLAQLLSPGLPRALPVPMHAHVPPTAPELRRERCSITQGMHGPVSRNGNWNFFFGGTRKAGPASVGIVGVRALRRG